MNSSGCSNWSSHKNRITQEVHTMPDTQSSDAPLEVRLFHPIELRMAMEGDNLIASGYVAVFNSLSEELPADDGTTFFERILPGAFTRTLAAPTLDCRLL